MVDGDVEVAVLVAVGLGGGEAEAAGAGDGRLAGVEGGQVWLCSLLGAAFVRRFGQQLRILTPANVHEN